MPNESHSKCTWSLLYKIKLKKKVYYLNTLKIKPIILNEFLRDMITWQSPGLLNNVSWVSLSLFAYLFIFLLWKIYIFLKSVTSK